MPQSNQRRLVRGTPRAQVLEAENNALIAAVNATADAQSAVIVNTARTTAFTSIQAAKAEAYKELRDKLDSSAAVEFTGQQMIESVSPPGLCDAAPARGCV